MMVELDNDLLNKLKAYLEVNSCIDAKTLMNIALNEFFYQSEKKKAKRKAA